MPWIVNLGDTGFCFTFLIIFTIVTWRFFPKNWRIGPIAAAIYGINAGIFLPIKHLIGRDLPIYAVANAIPRIDYFPYHYLTGAAFPSGHTVTAFFIANILVHQYGKYRYMFYGIACLVGFGLIYIGVHYPSDVVFGALLGYGVTKILRSNDFVRINILKEK
jgi:undecaprenyl-diphosphatase